MIWLSYKFLENSAQYYISVSYFPNTKDYADDFKLVVNGKEVKVNGEFLGKGAGGGLSYFYVDTTSRYSTIIPYGFASAKTNYGQNITDEDKTTLDQKMNIMFNKDGSTLIESEKLFYSDDNNVANNADANSNIAKVVGDGGKIEVVLRSSEVKKEGDKAVITSMEFDVTPKTQEGIPMHGNVGHTVTFRLPIDKDSDYKYANVKHEGTLLGQYEVKTDENGNKYIEVSSNQFSVFSYELTNVVYNPGSGSGSGSSSSSSSGSYIKPVVNTSAK